MSPESKQGSGVTRPNTQNTPLESLNNLIRSPLGRIAAAGSALALLTGIANERANAYTTGTLAIENHAVDRNGDGINETIATEIELGDYRNGEGFDFIRFETRTSPNSGADLVTEGDIGQFFDNDPSTPAGWVMSNSYQGDPYSGTITFDRLAPTGEFSYYAELNGFDQNGDFTIRSINNTFNLGTQPLPVPSAETPKPPVSTQPSVVPAKLLNLGLKLNTPRVLPRSNRAKLTIKPEVKADSTCSINGVGNGASKDAKLRKKAARVEIALRKTVPNGKLPKGMIGLRNGKLPKKHQAVNMVSVDIRSSGLNPGERQVSRLPFKLVKNAKSGGFSAKLFVPSGTSDCGSKAVSSKTSIHTAKKKR